MLSPSRIISRIPLSALAPNPRQPRLDFSRDSLESLAASLARHGQLSPILVRRSGVHRYEIIAGERRTRAARLLGWSDVDAIVVSAYDSEISVLALVENVQRENLHFLEEAAACRGILDSESITQEELAEKLGKSPSALANLLRLLKLPEEVRATVREGGLTERHARALLSVRDEESQLALAKRAAEEHMTVSRLESAITKRAPRALPRLAIRDDRIAVRTVTDAVKKLRDAGIAASHEVQRNADKIQITVTIARKRPSSD